MPGKSILEGEVINLESGNGKLLTGDFWQEGRRMQPVLLSINGPSKNRGGVVLLIEALI